MLILRSNSPSVQAIREIKGKPHWLRSRVIPLGVEYIGGSELLVEADTAGKGFSRKDLQKVMEKVVIIIKGRLSIKDVKKARVIILGENRIMAQLPGITEPESTMRLIGSTGLLEFRFLADPQTTMKVFSKMDQYLSGGTLGSARPFSGYLVPAGSDAAVEKSNYRAFKGLVEETRSVVPADAEILFGPEEEAEGRTIRKVYVVKKKAEITGADIKGAKAKPYQGSVPNYQGTWMVSMDLQRSGQVRFADVTGNNVGERLAIVFDNVVKSAPVIKERIPPGSAATITSNDKAGDEMRDLAILIRHGALPVPLEIVGVKPLPFNKQKCQVLAALIIGMIVSGGGLVFLGSFLVLKKKSHNFSE